MKDEQRIKEIEWRREDVLAEWLSPTPPGDEGQLIDNDIPWLIARVRELEAQAEKDAMRIRQLQAQAVKDAVVRMDKKRLDATASVYFASSTNCIAGEYVKALLNNADWFISQLRPLLTVVDAVEVLIKYGAPERDDDPEYNSECYYCHGGWATEEDGVMRIQHGKYCEYGMLRDALNALKNEEGQ